MFKPALIGIAAVATIALGPNFARAQGLPLPGSPYTTIVDVNWTGTVTKGADGSVTFRAADGTSVPYTGTVPAGAFQTGDPVSLKFQAVMPNQNYWTNNPFNPVKNASGIYSVPLYQFRQGQLQNGIAIGATSGLSLTVGSSTFVADEGLFGIKMNLVYDDNANTYSIDSSQPFSVTPLAGAGYRFDSASGQLVACSGIACDPTFNPNDGFKNSFGLTGSADGTQISTSNINIVGSDGGVWGAFRAGLSGNWNLPNFSAATAVPEPGMLGLFGAAALMLPLRRRIARRKAA